MKMTYELPLEQDGSLLYTPTPSNYRSSRLSTLSSMTSLDVSSIPAHSKPKSILQSASEISKHEKSPINDIEKLKLRNPTFTSTYVPSTPCNPIPNDPIHYAAYLVRLIQQQPSLTKDQVEAIKSILMPTSPIATIATHTNKNMFNTPDLTKVTLFPTSASTTLSDTPIPSLHMTPRALNFKSLRQIHKEKEHSSKDVQELGPPLMASTPKLEDPLDRLLLEVTATKANEENKPKRKLKMNSSGLSMSQPVL